MTQKDFILFLQKSCHIERQQCTTLLNTLGRLMADAGVDQIPVTLPGLGTFTSHKHPEYIKEDPVTRQQTLYPPRITYRMQSVEEGTAPNDALARQLSELTQTPLDDVKRFIAGLVEGLLTVMRRGEAVDIKGIGSFRIISSNQGDLQRVAYMPDEQMKEKVNAPFSFFEPVTIHK